MDAESSRVESWHRNLPLAATDDDEAGWLAGWRQSKTCSFSTSLETLKKRRHQRSVQDRDTQRQEKRERERENERKREGDRPGNYSCSYSPKENRVFVTSPIELLVNAVSLTVGFRFSCPETPKPYW